MSYQPYVSAAGVGSTSGPSIGYTYDAAGRVLDITDSDGGDVHYTYKVNDVEVTLSPAPQNENTKSRQLQYDALGRVVSVCEITSMSGSGACSQNTAQNGFFTSYTYDPLGNLLSVSQGGQMRAFSYDGLGRMLTEMHPETSSSGTGGTTTYAYDSIGSGNCAGSYKGDKIMRTDPAGNVTCYAWDGLHRLMKVTYPNSSTLSKGYIYDQSQLGLGNPLGRMVVAYTANGANWNESESFGYDARGSMTDFLQLTPDGSQYHTQNGYAANGLVGWRRGCFSTSNCTTSFTNYLAYNIDGAGRYNGLYDATFGEEVWYGTTYSPASQPSALVFSSGDSESFTWDSGTGRMKTWNSIVGSNTQGGTLTWNGNGTLGQLQITDTYHTGNAQTCAFGYDDLSRLTTDQCGSAWQQTFGYDAFGNIEKTGSSTFLVGYTSGNHISGYSYDGDGDLTYDGTTHYNYDAEGRPTSITGGPTAIYDAFNRLVEVQSGGVTTNLVYSPDGYKFAYMNGSTVKRYSAPLPAGLQVVYTAATPAGPAYWRHADWLGSERMASTSSRGIYYNGAYAPFGENYVETGTTDRSFTGQTQDTTAGLYDFSFRQQSSAQGRWLVPDPAGLAAADLTNPQTWNRYAYVANNPLNATDPLGLYCAIDPDGGLFHGCQQGGGLGGGDDEGDPYGLPGGFPIFWPVGGAGGGGGPAPSRPTPSPTPSPQPPQQPINFPNETLGLPNGFPLNPWGIAGVIIPDGNCADMGPCGAVSGYSPDGITWGSIWTGIEIGVSTTVSATIGAITVLLAQTGDAPPRGKWSCTASCNVQGIGGNIPSIDRVTGFGWGSNETEACVSAKRAATQSAPRGTYARHCQCSCSKR